MKEGVFLEREVKLVTLASLFVSLLLLGTLSPLVEVSEKGEGYFGTDFMVEAAETTTGGGIGKKTEGTYRINIFVDSVFVEERLCEYGEKIVLSDYQYQGKTVESWSYDQIYMDENGGVIGSEKIEVSGRTLEFTVKNHTNINGKTMFYEDTFRFGNKVYMNLLATQWEENGYPDYVGGAYKNGNNWMVYLKGDITENKGKLKEEIYDWELINYFECSYSRNELKAVESEINKNNPASFSGIRSVSITCQAWLDGITEPRVLVTMDSIQNYDVLAEKFAKKYGNKVMVGVYDEVLQVTFPPHAPKKVQIKSVRKKKNKLIIRWKKAEGAGKYQILIYRGKKRYKTFTSKKLTCKCSVKKAGKYQVKVRAYGKKVKRWGMWSQKVKIK